MYIFQNNSPPPPRASSPRGVKKIISEKEGGGRGEWENKQMNSLWIIYSLIIIFSCHFSIFGIIFMYPNSQFSEIKARLRR